MQERMSFWTPVGTTAAFVMFGETIAVSIGTPEAAVIGRILEGGVVFWCLYHLFTKTFPQIQESHAKNVERVCDTHDKACAVYQETMLSLTNSMKDDAVANREGMEALRKEWSDTRNTLVSAINKTNTS